MTLSQGTTLQLAERLSRSGFVTGHGFSHADRANKISWALAPEGWFFSGLLGACAFFRNPFNPYNNVAKISGLY
jgi:hypothetical protein